MFSLFSYSFFAVTGKDYMYMNTSVYRNGTSFVESLFDTFGKWGVFMRFMSLNILHCFGVSYYAHKFGHFYRLWPRGPESWNRGSKEKARDKPHQPHCLQASKKSSLWGLPTMLCSLDLMLIYSASLTLMSVCNKGYALQRWDTAGRLIMLQWNLLFSFQLHCTFRARLLSLSHVTITLHRGPHRAYLLLRERTLPAVRFFIVCVSVFVCHY